MSFWCITTFFNPAGYKSITTNYNLFKSNLDKQKVKLLTLELAFGDDLFCLPETLDIIHLRGHSVMWHKERLINYAASILPDSCTSYGWVDCDLLFTDANWATNAQKQLEKYDVIQLFKRVYYLPRGDTSYNGQQTCMFNGIVCQRDHYSGWWDNNWLAEREAKTLPFAAPGFGWAARHDTFKDIGIYDRDVVGSGDCVLVDCLLDSWNLHGYKRKFNDAMKSDIQEWCAEVKKKKLSIGYLPVDVFHLWHGNFKNRKYMTRHDILLANNYDPKTDITLINDVFEWATPKEQMHEDVKQYFYERCEDDA